MNIKLTRYVAIAAVAAALAVPAIHAQFFESGPKAIA